MFGRLFGRGKKTPSEEPMRDVAALVAHLAVPAIHVVAAESPSGSYFGGWPALPPGVAWPTRNGVKLGFLAQLSLAEVQRAAPVPWLPSTGALLFFYDIEEQPWGFDPKDRGGWAVLHVPDAAAPGTAGDGAGDASAALVPQRFIEFRTLPSMPSWERDEVIVLGLNDREHEAFCTLTTDPFAGRPQHQIAGFPRPVQSDLMERECQLASHGIYCGGSHVDDADQRRTAELEGGAVDWRLLLQFDTDDELGLMWGDGGMIYFWVQEQEARAGNFSNAWLVLQCY